MVAALGDIQAKDDYTHPLGPEENFNESMYYNFFDPKAGAGGFVRIGNRANEGYAEVTVCLYLPTGEVAFNYLRPRIESNDAMDAAGMRFEVIEPLVKHRATYDGEAVLLKDPAQMADPSKAFRENPHAKVQVDIESEAMAPVYGSAGHNRTETQGQEFARAHYEQHMRTRGTITVNGETTRIDGTGLRDHSWGPRYWQAIHSYRWLTCAFGPDFSMTVSEVSPSPDVHNHNGIVIRGEKVQRITSVDIDSIFEPGSMFHKKMTARVGTHDGEELVLEGTVKSFIPLRNRRAGMITHIGEGMTEYRCDGHVCYGISEYLDQVQ